MKRARWAIAGVALAGVAAALGGAATLGWSRWQAARRAFWEEYG